MIVGVQCCSWIIEINLNLKFYLCSWVCFNLVYLSYDNSATRFKHFFLWQILKFFFVANRSNYKKVPGFDCYDEKKNALLHPPAEASLYHPPCRLFSKLRHFSSAPVSEKWCALWSMYFVRVYGGIVEHPYDSRLWSLHGITQVNTMDEFGGFWYVVDQHWFGFPIRKRTGLYIVGITPKELPRLNLKLYQPTRKFDNLTKKQRSESTPAFIAFLKEIMLLIKK